VATPVVTSRWYELPIKGHPDSALPLAEAAVRRLRRELDRRAANCGCNCDGIEEALALAQAQQAQLQRHLLRLRDLASRQGGLLAAEAHLAHLRAGAGPTVDFGTP